MKRSSSSSSGGSSLKKNLVDFFKSWGLMSTCHGVASVAKSDRWLIKILYVLAIACSIGYFGFNFLKVLAEYYKYETVSRIETVRLTSIQFPTITICNSNLLNPARAASYITSFQQSDIYREWTYLQDSYTPKEYFEIGKNLYMVTIDQNVAARYGYTLDDMLLSCYFNSEQCVKEDFEYFYSTRYGNCYKFNSPHSGPLKESGVSGISSGLQLELFTGVENASFTNFGRTGGAHVFINNYTVDPLENEGYDIANGLETSIVLDLVHEERLDQPFSNCVVNLRVNGAYDSEFYRQTMHEKNFYSRSYCLLLCYQHQVVQTCGCNDPQAPLNQDFHRCNTINETICFMNEFAQFYSKTGTVGECLNLCPIECETYAFHASAFEADYPSVEYATALINYRNYSSIFPANLTSYGALKRSILSLNIFYKDIGYTLYRELPAKSVEQLIADIGGYMALCLGISILSAVEVLELLLEVLFITKESSSGTYAGGVNPWKNLD